MSETKRITDALRNAARALEVLADEIAGIDMDAPTAPEVGKPNPERSVSDLINVEEAAEMTRLSPATVRWLIADGRFAPSAKVGRRRMFRRADLEAWIAGLTDGALVLLARAGLDLNVLETEMKRIETTCNDQEGAS